VPSLRITIVRERLDASRLPSATLRRFAVLTRPARSQGLAIAGATAGYRRGQGLRSVDIAQCRATTLLPRQSLGAVAGEVPIRVNGSPYPSFGHRHALSQGLVHEEWAPLRTLASESFSSPGRSDLKPFLLKRHEAGGPLLPTSGPLSGPHQRRLARPPGPSQDRILAMIVGTDGTSHGPLPGLRVSYGAPDPP
jgi:hypothetical protein